jgi:two-component system KDP operon response regulator KdpE
VIDTARVLVIDDDANLMRLLRESLAEAGYDVDAATNGRDGIAELEDRAPDLVVLDVMMPRMDGWSTLEQIRKQSEVPVIMLSARDSEADRLRGFDLGVDDYVTKPFSLRELNARVKAVLARARPATSDDGAGRVHVADLVVDSVSRQAFKRGEELPLTPTEYRLLAVLAERPGKAVSNQDLLRRVWGPEYSDEPDHVKRYVWYLRRKIEDDPSNPRYVETVRGFGYRLAAT